MIIVKTVTQYQQLSDYCIKILRHSTFSSCINFRKVGGLIAKSGAGGGGGHQ